LLKDQTSTSSSVNAITSKLYQFVVANMNDDTFKNRNKSRKYDFENDPIIDLEASGMSGDGSGNSGGSGDGAELSRSSRTHGISADLMLRNRPLILAHDDFLPEIKVGDSDIAEVDRYFSNIQNRRGDRKYYILYVIYINTTNYITYIIVGPITPS